MFLTRCDFEQYLFLFLHFRYDKFNFQKFFIHFIKLGLTHKCPRKKWKDFMNFVRKIFSVAVVKLRFQVAVAVGQTTARRGMVAPKTLDLEAWGHPRDI